MDEDHKRVPHYETEAGRLEQGGMGYLTFHAALTWMRTWLNALIDTGDVKYYTQGSAVRQLR